MYRSQFFGFVSLAVTIIHPSVVHGQPIVLPPPPQAGVSNPETLRCDRPPGECFPPCHVESLFAQGLCRFATIDNYEGPINEIVRDEDPTTERTTWRHSVCEDEIGWNINAILVDETKTYRRAWSWSVSAGASVEVKSSLLLRLFAIVDLDVTISGGYSASGETTHTLRICFGCGEGNPPLQPCEIGFWELTKYTRRGTVTQERFEALDVWAPCHLDPNESFPPGTRVVVVICNEDNVSANGANVHTVDNVLGRESCGKACERVG